MKKVRAGYFGEMTKTLNLEDLIIEFSAFNQMKFVKQEISLYLIQGQIGGSHNAYFKQEISLYLLLKEIQLFVWFSAEMSCSIARRLYDTVVALRDMEPRRDIDIMALALATNKI